MKKEHLTAHIAQSVFSERIKETFARISPRYDLLNHLLSGGRDIFWRKAAADATPENSRFVLDLACGTADMAIAVAKQRPSANVVGVDFSPQMLGIGARKVSDRALAGRISFFGSDITQLPFKDRQFDAATIAFGLRNTYDRLAALSEFRRVLKPGGKLVILEMTLPKKGFKGRFFRWYLKNVVPATGGMLTGNRGAYDYLKESITEFLSPEELTEYLLRAGFVSVKPTPLTFGITYIHEAYAA